MKTKTGIFLSLLIGLAAACVPTSVQNSPTIVVPVTVVDQAMLGQAVAAVLTATASSGVAATETALAVAGITLTPTPTPTLTPSPTATRFESPTPTGTPTNTPVPTNTPLPSNTPGVDVEPVNGQIRVVHAWRPSDNIPPVDVFMDDVPIALGLEPGDATPYYSVGGSRSVRIVLMQPAERSIDPRTSEVIIQRLPVLAQQVIAVPEGSSITAALVDTGSGPNILVIPEDISPLATGQARATIVNANANLPPFDVEETITGVAFAHNMSPGDYRGAFDLPAGNYSLQLIDSDAPDQLLIPSMELALDTYLNYLVMFIPTGQDQGGTAFTTRMLVIPGSTRIGTADTPVRFVNAAPKAGALGITIDGVNLVTRLDAGEVTLPLPMGMQGGLLQIRDQSGRNIYTVNLAAWPEDAADVEKLFMIYDIPSEEVTANNLNDVLRTITFVRQSPSSLALANIRLIDALTGATQTVDLEMRATDRSEIDNPIGIPQAASADLAWSSVIRNISFGEASDFVTRASNVFDLRVVLSISGSVQAALERQSFLPGGMYDILALPGSSVGETRLIILGSEPQMSILGSRRGDPQVVQQIVDATLTALAPEGIATLGVSRTPTPTISPVPTNTPRPTNTPLVKTPAVQVNPAPPNAASGSFILIGQNFKPNVRYSINLDDSGTLFEGLVSAEGEVALTVNLPPGITPGPHVVRVCADCREGGAQQEALAAFLVADPRTTPTQTPQP